MTDRSYAGHSPAGASGAGRPWSPGSPGSSTRWARRAVASFSTYEEAERAVDRLADRDFPVERVAIIGQELETVEQVTGRMDYPTAAWRGALSGAVPGALIGWIFGLFDWADPLVSALLLALYGLLIGAVIGAIIGMIVYALQRGRRDFSSVTFMRPRRYEVVVDDEVADEAARLLASEA
ncbi:general stress protein [Blastococcus brunescens]|uniref:General stress protein n=1 Tax=Blastococcus brunescens TaxID=1564165 RepID=A0ABZ1ATE6_9ACTN|nr:general stress protein [Blastococcus sp. BMG 8361]WRL61837.1 general stress protein [Blastococcus sp. BMG 8361]